MICSLTRPSIVDYLSGEFAPKYYITNHSVSDMTYQNILKNGWYWYGMVSDINDFIKFFSNCNTSNKFKKLKVAKKLLLKMTLIIIILLIWPLPKEISKDTRYKYPN